MADAVSIKITSCTMNKQPTQNYITLAGRTAPNKCTPEGDHIISIAYRNVNCSMYIKPLAIERKLVIAWDFMHDDVLDDVYTKGILKFITDNKSVYFKVTVTGDAKYKSMIEGLSPNSIFYLGDTIKLDVVARIDGITIYSVEMHLIEAEPRKLNSISTGGVTI